MKSRLTEMLDRTVGKIRDYDKISHEAALINSTRIYYLSLVAILVRIIILISFKPSYDTPELSLWSRGIIASHLVLLVFMIGFFLITAKQKNKDEPGPMDMFVQYATMVVIMVSGIVIVTFDQLITTNITPFMLTCMICGLVILIKPTVSLLIYVASYVMFYYLLALTVTNPHILLSNRINGITSVGIGFLLSVILWNYNYTAIIQKKRIEEQQKQLELMAYHDSLTGLPNRRYFDKIMKEELALIRAYGHKSVIVVLDIDNFKNINDSYGHLAGDNVLKQMAGILKSSMREKDRVSRYGGEEFIILMAGTALEEGYAFAEELRQRICREEFKAGPSPLQITSSFGVSVLNGHREKFEDYYHMADKALYLAKQRGKNRVEVIREI